MISYQSNSQAQQHHPSQPDLYPVHHRDKIDTIDPTDEFHHLVRALSEVLGPSSGIDSADVDENDLIRLMEEYHSNESHWQPYAFADLTRNYTRNLVDEGNGKSNLLVVVWNPGKCSPIHDHADAHCVMKLLKGSLKETLYDKPHLCDASELSGATTPPRVVKETIYTENQVTYISDQLGLHKIANVSDTDVAVSLHLYTPPHAANFGFNLFDERTGKQTHIKQAGFYSDRGKVVESKFGSF
ncbi:hypothetical protein PV10_09040 [Exophiala mesophila]|uniref:Cysteine dioxygenase n=1 Tax=Exophiala mesophila TaxID=212818 RepID=A0A0D1Z2H7_EXOME|nr:uncharacterized protein PV10_09040 [Exophiala mesophila]KIV88114.1 hypothetical protein PV10_09040 [Exophiala mesophila]